MIISLENTNEYQNPIMILLGWTRCLGITTIPGAKKGKMTIGDSSN
jgi:hypothetical protein